MDQTTSLVVAGCLCVVAASLVIIVVLRLYQTFSERKIRTSVPPVSQQFNRFSDYSSTTLLTNSETQRVLNSDDIDDQKSSAMLPL